MPDPVQERFFAERLLSLLNLGPANLVVSDKPDIRFELGGKRIGLEITRVDSQEFRRGEIMHMERMANTAVSTTGLHDDHGRRRTSDELLETMGSYDTWENVGTAMERWARSCAGALVTKTRVLNRPDFERHDEDWLLIVGIDGPADDVVSVPLALESLANAICTVVPCPDFNSAHTAFFMRTYFHFESHLYLLSGDRLERIAPVSNS